MPTFRRAGGQISALRWEEKMCGILGMFGSNINRERFKVGLDRIIHRGPDAEGIWFHENVILGHRRLSILDLSSAGSQPMHSADERYVIVFNGEIYNYVEIREELKSKGYQFVSNCDTEVVLASFQEWGKECLNRFNGMWAFSIYDKNQKSLFLSRDRFGIKPFYYAITHDGIVFGSEMKALAPMLDKKTVNHHLIGKINIDKYESTENTLICEIKKLPAGHCMWVNETGVRIEKWWNTLANLIDVPKAYSDKVDLFRSLFEDSCRIRMRSDVKLGTALSGGLDSSATICMMNHIVRKSSDECINRNFQHAFVACFPGTSLDEAYYADRVTDYLGIGNTKVFIDAKKGLDELEEMLWLFEEIYYTSPVPMMQTYKAMREAGVYVTLDGHGADELFGGYSGDILYALMDAKNREEKEEIIDTYFGMFPKSGNNSLSSSRNVILAKNQAKYLVKKVLGVNNDRVIKGIGGLAELGHFERLLYNRFHITTLPTLLRNYDRYSMANSVEIRMPFMDYRLVQYAFSLDWRSKLHRGYSKCIVRDALQDVMPEEVTWRRSKIGFNTPIVEWMQGAWKEWLLDTVHSDSFINTNVLNSKKVRREIEHCISNPSLSYWQAETAFSNLMPFLWEKNFYKKL